MPRTNGETDTARRRDHLLWRIRRRYHTVTEQIDVGGGLRLTFTRVADPDVVLDEVAAEEDRLERLAGKRTPADALHLPYWAELWDSAAGVGQFVRARRERFDGTDVLDLGCGMGLAGATAAACGARVTFADLEAPALLFARLNSLPWADRVRTRRLNWRTDQLGERFDHIIGADILYERKQWEFLEPFWRAHLKPGATVLLGEPGRQTGDAFAEWIASRGWGLTKSEQGVVTRERPIRIFEISPSSQAGA